MSLQTRAAWLLGTTLLATIPAPVRAQVAEARLQPTATAETAKTAFRSALYESQNVRPGEAREHLTAALAADPQFGLARVYQTVLATGMTPAAREAAISQNLGAMGGATPAEVLLALYWREAAAGRGAAARPILKAASDLVPGDPEIAYIYYNTQPAAKSAAEQASALRQFLQRYPAHGAAHNQLAYTLWRAGDPDGALAAVQQYVKYAPDHPNAHDSYADILLLMRRGEEAIPHVKREIELDADFPGAHTKLGTIYLTLGNISEARTHFTTAASKAATPAERIEVAYWQAAAHIYERNSRNALREISRVTEIARTENMAGALALSYDRAALVDAYIGNSKAVAAHLAAADAAASNPNQKATYQAHAAIALSRIGRTAEARAAATKFAASTDADANIINSLNAIIALDSKDYGAAEAAIAKLTEPDVLTNALRAELMLRTGRKAEGQALRQAVLASSVKVDGNAPVDFIALVGRMRADKL